MHDPFELHLIYSYSTQSDEYFDTHFVYLKLIFQISVFLISSVGDEQGRSRLIPLYHMSILSKHTKYRKIGDGKNMEIFFFEKRYFFGDKIPVFSEAVLDTVSELNNLHSRPKVT